MQFLSCQSCNLKITHENLVRFSVRFVAALSQGFRACLKLDATKIASSCRYKNCLCKWAFSNNSHNLPLSTFIIACIAGIKHGRGGGRVGLFSPPPPLTHLRLQATFFIVKLSSVVQPNNQPALQQNCKRVLALAHFNYPHSENLKVSRFS